MNRSNRSNAQPKQENATAKTIWRPLALSLMCSCSKMVAVMVASSFLFAYGEPLAILQGALMSLRSSVKIVKTLWIFHEKTMLERLIRCKKRDQIDEIGVVGHVFRDVRMRPVRAPQHAIRSLFHERGGEGNGIGKRRPGGRDTLGPADFHPGILKLHQIQQGLEGRLVEPRLGLHTAHMVDNERHRQGL